MCALDAQTWSELRAEPEKAAPAWETLLLDASAVLPQIGPAIVLAYTALEVLIAAVLSDLAARDPSKQALWTWVQTLDYVRRPSVSDHYSDLFSLFTGQSLKSDQKLWEKFCRLRRARNTFVHEGTALADAQPVDADGAGELILAAREIVKWVREQLPTDLRWQVHEREHRFGVRLKEIKEL